MSRAVRRIVLVALGALVLGVPGAWAASAPVVVGSVGNASSLSEAASVAVSGNYAYTTAYGDGVLTAVDIANPAAPVVAGSSAAAPSLFNGATVNIANGYAYVVSKNRNASRTSNDDGTGNALTILDIHTNPAVPAIVGTYQSSTNLFGAYGVAVSGNYAYVAAQGLLQGQPSSPDTSTGAFSVIDVANPAAPTLVGHVDNGSLPAPWSGTNALEHICSVFVAGNYAYVTAFDSNRLTIIDIANPANPTIVSSLQDSTNLELPADVAVSGNYAYVADQTPSSAHTGFTVVDVANPSAPKVVSEVVGAQAQLAGAYRVRVHGNFAYVAAANTDTVSAIDISNPASPRLAGSVQSATALNVPIGLDFDPNGGFVIASSAIAVGQPNPTYPPFSPSLTTGTITAIQLDPAALGVTIAPASKPATKTSQTSASFSFATSDQVATVQCRLASGPFTACTSPTTQKYSALALGRHTFTVETANALGATSSASYSWTVEGARPSIGRAKLLGGGALSVTATCAKIAGTVCHVTLTVVVTETFKGKKLIAVTAAKKSSKTVVLASKSLTLAAGKHRTVKLTLGRAGQKLLAKSHKLAAKLVLAQPGSNHHTTTVSSQKLTFRSAKR